MEKPSFDSVAALMRELSPAEALALTNSDNRPAVKKFLAGFSTSVSSRPPLVGSVVKKLALKPYTARSVAEAIKLGKYDGVDDDIVTQFAEDEVGLTEAASVDLVQFDRDVQFDVVLAWASANKRTPIMSKHIYGIGVQCPDEQREASIVESGSVRQGDVLYLGGSSGWRGLYRYTVEGDWARDYLFGFLSE